jgi:hypothetical protein
MALKQINPILDQGLAILDVFHYHMGVLVAMMKITLGNIY